MKRKLHQNYNNNVTNDNDFPSKHFVINNNDVDQTTTDRERWVVSYNRNNILAMDNPILYDTSIPSVRHYSRLFVGHFLIPL